MADVRYVGIYTDAIESAIDSYIEALKKAGFTEQEIENADNMVEEDLEETGSFSDITNSIIDSYFRVAKDLIESKKPELDPSYYVNCHDSHFYLGGELV